MPPPHDTAECPKRPEPTNGYQSYVLHRLDELHHEMHELDQHLADVRVDVGRLQGRARAWGAFPGAAAVIISLVALLLGIK